MSGRGLRGRIGSRVRALTGADETAAARVELAMLRAEIATESARLDDLAGALAAATAGLTESRTRFEEVLAVELAHRRETVDDIPRLREQLRAARTDPDYDAAFDEADPLVTVRIASYQRTQELLEVALPSAFDQTHRNLEIVIVNDGPNPATREALDALDDPRVRYHELPERGRYPEHPLSRWRVAGTPAGNRGLELATGRWIAPLDEDDAFTPDHVEVLLALARDRRAELAYGAVRQHNVVTGEDRTIWSDPPTYGAFSLQGALYHRALTLFRYEPLAWTLHEPGDWNLARRMLDAGVRTASTERTVATLNWVPLDERETGPAPSESDS